MPVEKREEKWSGVPILREHRDATGVLITNHDLRTKAWTGEPLSEPRGPHDVAREIHAMLGGVGPHSRKLWGNASRRSELVKAGLASMSSGDNRLRSSVTMFLENLGTTSRAGRLDEYLDRVFGYRSELDERRERLHEHINRLFAARMKFWKKPSRKLAEEPLATRKEVFDALDDFFEKEKVRQTVSFEDLDALFKKSLYRYVAEAFEDRGGISRQDLIEHLRAFEPRDPHSVLRSAITHDAVKGAIVHLAVPSPIKFPLMLTDIQTTAGIASCRLVVAHAFLTALRNSPEGRAVLSGLEIPEPKR